MDWEILTSRCDEHRKHLLGVINGDGEPSHYRAALARNIEQGTGRALKQEDNLYPGYYGPRGFNLMSDYLVEEFGGMLKEKAVGDRVISGRGSAAFIQAVLVAELAVQLIMEDMGVDANVARELMEGSKAIGELVHEE